MGETQDQTRGILKATHSLSRAVLTQVDPGRTSQLAHTFDLSTQSCNPLVRTLLRSIPRTLV